MEYPNLSEYQREWEVFARRLSERMRILERGETLDLMRTDPSSGLERRILQVTVTGSKRVRCTARRNTWLELVLSDPAAQQWQRQRGVMVSLGWRRLRSGDHIVESGRRSVADLADQLIAALREIWDIADPAEVRVRDSSREATAPTTSYDRPPHTRPIPISSPAAATVDATHLLTLARETLQAVGLVLTDVNDRSISVDVDGVHTRLLVSPYALRVELCTVIAHGTPDLVLLGAVIAEHSARWPDVSIVVTKGHVFAVRAIDATVFHPSNLVSALQDWTVFLREGAIDIIEQLQPDQAAWMRETDAVGIDAMPEGLAALLREYREEPESLTSDELARRTRANTPLLRRYARICSEHLAAMKPWLDADVPGGTAGTEWTEQSRDIEAFLPVLTRAVGVAARWNGRWETAA
ncbi:hypothetical protein GCM10027169_24550 [Gordonia jinhuaensis]|uniref:TY-Chap N-terminal domain-containing protein n=1 Tax=Gordonia jinhuaensis TaxID=1517702 RepID=A0A916WYB0_9ACTN|nr:hypothetical protein [Gordonia jinhuaensis]GGB39923.1 hypothetical protein GCM10011489_29430 [Gordonia jinhuaensis]